MTEEQIEIWVENQMDRLDAKYMQGNLTNEEYQYEVKKISKKAEELK